MADSSLRDVVIIGGGHNGLVCAAYLASAGLKVTVSQVDGPGAAGSVVGTDPAAGTSVKKNSTVTLQLSNGNQGGQQGSGRGGQGGTVFGTGAQPAAVQEVQSPERARRRLLVRVAARCCSSSGPSSGRTRAGAKELLQLQDDVGEKQGEGDASPNDGFVEGTAELFQSGDAKDYAHFEKD